MLHDTLDKKFEQMTTDNQKSDKIFARKMKQDYDVEEIEINSYFRPHNLTSRHEENLIENYKTLSGLGYLENKVINSDVSKVL